MLLTPGEPAPWFRAATPSQPDFTFDSVAGRFILLGFLPLDPAARLAALQQLSKFRPFFDDQKLSAFGVVRDPQTAQEAQDLQGLRWILDADGEVSRKYGAVKEDGSDNPIWILLDPTLRVFGSARIDEIEPLFPFLTRLPAPADHAGVPLHAPVLIAPRVFEPEFCRGLIELYEGEARAFSGVMRDVGQRTHAVMDELKKRRDLLIEDPALIADIHRRLETRLFPWVKRALGFSITRVERYLVSCYDAADGGVFHAHRDNTTRGTAHRRFAGSINLNDDYEGGDLRFPEFGPTAYRPPVGGACVFSCTLLHEATRVTAGRRYAFLPFFYDEAAAEVLEAYRAGATQPISKDD